MILGLTGYPGAGKDTAANFLVRELGFKKISFADKLKDLAYKTNPVILVDDAPYYLRGLVDEYGWDKAKRDALNVRVYLQNLGQGCREAFEPDFWIKQALTSDILENNENIVISDVRYDNEVQYIVENEGYILRIHRNGYGPVNTHISEKELPYDYMVDNINGLQSALEINLRDLIRGLRTLHG